MMAAPGALHPAHTRSFFPLPSAQTTLVLNVNNQAGEGRFNIQVRRQKCGVLRAGNF